MGEYAIKVLLTAVLVVAIAELSKRSTAIGALVASLPLTSLLAFVWLYAETGDAARIAALSQSIFWYVLPSLVLFIVVPLMVSSGFGFWTSLAVAMAATAAAYAVMRAALAYSGIAL